MLFSILSDLWREKSLHLILQSVLVLYNYPLQSSSGRLEDVDETSYTCFCYFVSAPLSLLPLFPVEPLCCLNSEWGLICKATHRGPPPVSYNAGSNVLGCRHQTPGWPCFPQLRGIHFSVILFVRVTCIFMKVCFHLTDTINRFSYYSLQMHRLIQQKAWSGLQRKEEPTEWSTRSS